MAKTIYKHRFVCTVFSEDAESFGELSMESVAAAIDTGSDIGDFKYEGHEVVPPEKLQAELLAIGNDGLFFTGLDDEPADEPSDDLPDQDQPDPPEPGEQPEPDEDNQ